MYVGSTFMFGSWLMAIFTIIVFALLNHRASNEERLMKVRFKEYVKYEKNVRKWL
jgi:protein-S-isoprenylcysteine O-methyltransferase Ste14